MRSVRSYGVERDWHTTAWMAAGFGLAAVGGFFGSLLREREAPAAGQRSPVARAEPGADGPAAVVRTAVILPEREPLARPAEAKV